MPNEVLPDAGGSDQLTRNLEKIEERIVNAHKLIDGQRQVVTQLEQAGRTAAVARGILDCYEKVRADLITARERVREELELAHKK